MSKRPTFDLDSITAVAAVPLPEAAQRQPSSIAAKKTMTAELEPLAFKVPPAFRKRFKDRAYSADLKLVDLLTEALDSWERERGIQ